MQQLLSIALVSLGVNVLWAQTPQLAPAEPADMQIIFNGKDLTGWDGDFALWSVKDGAIRGETTSENRAPGNTFLVWTGGKTKNFELRLTYRCNAANNSGVQYRSKVLDFKPDARNKWRMRGYQHEIRNEVKLPSVTGFLYDEGGKRGRICLVGEKAVWQDGKKQVTDKLITQEEFNQLFKLNDWNEVVIIARDKHIKHYLNGRLILDFVDGDDVALLDGQLGLQLHAGASMWTEFKDIRIKEL